MGHSLTFGVLITNYNTWDNTIECVTKIAHFFGTDCKEIVIVDDVSDQKPSFEFPEMVKIFYNKVNVGYVRSVNVGMKEMTSDVVLLLDSDAMLISNISKQILEQFENEPKLGALGFQLVDKKGLNTGCWENEPNFWSLVLGQKLYEKFYKTVNRNAHFIVYSCAIAIRRACFVELDGFDENFDFLDGDADFTMRVNRSSWKLKRLDHVKIYHEGGGSPQKTSKRVLRYYVNRYRLLQKHGLLFSRFLVKNATLCRLSLEYILLYLAGRFVYDSVVFQDKLKGRKEVIAYVYASY
ncbi:MAG TPA: hypothetical protein DCR46_00320 [Cytophagales bacterium]|nr:hypothetical protein [Cytophagales bacterium]